ncbi:NAD-dependent epimerase/dehydratase family protein [Desulfoscipio geothermicus]|nr:NAD-dependent epimerase/dehydratase family protein [Desulfoscipio geothermicus]
MMDGLDGKKVLVAGGGGFLGSYICKALLQEGAEITVLDIIPGSKMKNLEDIRSGIHILNGSVTDEESVFYAVQGMDAVVDVSFPAAACNRDLDKQYVSVGTAGVFNLLKASLSQGAHFIFASSISVYGVQQYTPINEQHPVKPFLLYGATKLAGENYCRVMADQYGCKVIILRFSDLYGPNNGRNSAPVNMLRKALNREPLPVTGDGRQVRSYLYITDAAQAIVCALKNFRQGGIYNITGPKALSILELAGAVRQVAGVNVPVRFMTNTGLDPRNYNIDGTLAAKEIDFRPRVDITKGLALTLEWLEGRSEY